MVELPVAGPLGPVLLASSVNAVPDCTPLEMGGVVAGVAGVIGGGEGAPLKLFSHR